MIRVKDLPLEVWQEYKRTRCPKLRSKIAEHYIDIAWHFSKKIGKMISGKTFKRIYPPEYYLGNNVLALYKLIDKYDHENHISFVFYCIQFMKFAVIDIIRSETGRNYKKKIEPKQIVSNEFSLENNVFFEDKQQCFFFDDAISKISDKQKKVIYGLYQENKTMKQISIDMGVSESYVCLLEKNALEELREILSDDNQL